MAKGPDERGLGQTRHRAATDLAQCEQTRVAKAANQNAVQRLLWRAPVRGPHIQTRMGRHRMAGFAGDVGGAKSGGLHQQLHTRRHLGLQDLLQSLCGHRVGVGVDQQIAAL